MQRISLIALIALLVCSVRYESLRKVYWYNLVLWQWLTLMLMVSCGRLIAGGAVQVHIISQHICLLLGFGQYNMLLMAHSNQQVGMWHICASELWHQMHICHIELKYL